MDAVGVLDERYDEVDDIVRARRVPSPQLIGTPERASIDVNTLTAQGRARRRAAWPDIARRRRAVLRLARQPLRPRRSQDEPAADQHRRVGTGAGLDDDVDPPRALRADPHGLARRRSSLDLGTARSARSSGHAATAPTTPGSTSPSSTAADASATTAASSAGHPASTCWAPSSCAAAAPRSSTAPNSTHSNSATTFAACSTDATK